MIQRAESLAQISEKAVRLLVKELGLSATVRFLSQFQVGSGNYTEERRAQLSGKTVDELAREIRQWRESAK
jgi:hypothetical protein